MSRNSCSEYDSGTVCVVCVCAVCADILAPCATDAGLVLVGEAKLAASAGEIPRLVAALKHRAADCPALSDKRLVFALWILRPPVSRRDKTVFGPEEVIANSR
jgi:hypothetical protein